MHVLVVANRTATSEQLVDALRNRTRAGATSFELVVPPAVPGAAGRAAAKEMLDAALERFETAGLQASGRVGTDTDVVIAVCEAYDARRHDEVVVCTLPSSSSNWTRANVPARIARATDALVHHVVASEPLPPREPAPAPARSSDGVLAPLIALGYGRHRAV